jgi:hypothetical protein
MRHKLTNLIVVALTAFGLTACDEGTLAPSQGTIVVFLTDAEGDVKEVWVQIEEMYVRGNGERFDLLDEPTDWIELTALAQSSLELVDGVELPAGTYQELRMVLGDAVLVTMTDEVFKTPGADHPAYEADPEDGLLNCPSCSQSGFKVKLPGGGFELTADGYVMLADFDVSQSFGRERGSSSQWVMDPTIHAAALQAGGSISGTVALAAGLVPTCPDGSNPGLDVFVPTATAQNLEDGDMNAIVRTGETDVIGLNGYTLMFTAEVSDPTAEVVEGGAVEGIIYTVTGADCVVAGP